MAAVGATAGTAAGMAAAGATAGTAAGMAAEEAAAAAAVGATEEVEGATETGVETAAIDAAGSGGPYGAPFRYCESAAIHAWEPCLHGNAKSQKIARHTQCRGACRSWHGCVTARAARLAPFWQDRVSTARAASPEVGSGLAGMHQANRGQAAASGGPGRRRAAARGHRTVSGRVMSLRP